MADLDGSTTHENLKAALAAESLAGHRYLWFAQQADVAGHPDAAALFRSVSEVETGHAHGHLDHLVDLGDPATGGPVGDTDDNFRAAIACETHEAETMYPRFAATARDEGFDDIAEWFDSLAEAEQRNVDRLRLGLDAL